jgi:hypothetical protein
MAKNLCTFIKVQCVGDNTGKLRPGEGQSGRHEGVGKSDGGQFGGFEEQYGERNSVGSRNDSIVK